MKIYLAGPMRHLPNFNYEAFDKAAARLRAAGHTVFSPADNDREKGYTKEIADAGGVVSPELHRRIIKDDLVWIIEQADTIAFLPGWDGETIPPCVEINPIGLPGLKCEWVRGRYLCTWNGSVGAKLEDALGTFLGLEKRFIPREWVV